MDLYTFVKQGFSFCHISRKIIITFFQMTHNTLHNTKANGIHSTLLHKFQVSPEHATVNMPAWPEEEDQMQ